MRKESKISGMNEVMRNLNAEIQAIKGRSANGLIQAGMLVRRDMEVTPPVIPVDTGNLRASWFTTLIRNLNLVGLTLGFSANYAVFVHENVGADFVTPRWRYDKKRKKRKYWYTPREGAGAKFFESALKNNKDNILKIIRDNAKIQ